MAYGVYQRRCSAMLRTLVHHSQQVGPCCNVCCALLGRTGCARAAGRRHTLLFLRVAAVMTTDAGRTGGRRLKRRGRAVA